jgi:hypothetical protein
MKKPTDKAKELTDKLADRFFLGVTPSFFNEIKALANTKAYCKDIVESFIANLESIDRVVSIPYVLSEQFANNRAFSMHLSRNAILHPELNHEQLLEIARKEFQESFEDQNQANRIFIDLCMPLIEIPQDEKDPAKELLNQGILLTWSAFEVFCRDYIEKRLNDDPMLCIPIFNSEMLRRRSDLRKLPLEYLISNKFNISEKVGTIIVENYDCSDLLILKEILFCITNKDEIRECMDDKKLWNLFQIRHLIMHRRGIIDKTFLDKTNIDQAIGEKIIIRPNELYKNIRMIQNTVKAIII